MDWTIFWTILKGGGEEENTPLVPRRGGMKSISTEGGLGGRVLLLREGREKDYFYAGVGGGCNSKHYWLMELLLDRTNYFNWFFD